MEVAFDQRRARLRGAQIAADVAKKFRRRAGACTPDGIGLDVLIEVFVGVEIGTVAGQEEHAEASVAAFDPGLDRLGHVDGMSIDDQDEQAGALSQQAPQEAQEDRHGKPTAKHHEMEFAAIGNGRDHVAAEALSSARDHGSHAAGAERTTCRMVGPHPGFVRPKNLRPRAPRQVPDGRILLAQPAAHLPGIPFEGLPGGLLCGEAPAFQVAPHRPHRHANATTSSDELSYRLSCPQVERQFQLVRTMILKRGHHHSFLPGLQPSSSWPTAPARLQAPHPRTPAQAHPSAHRLPRHTEDRRHLALRASRLHRSDRLEPNLFLRLRRKRPKVFGCVHAQRVAYEPLTVKYLLL